MTQLTRTAHLTDVHEQLHALTTTLALVDNIYFDIDVYPHKEAWGDPYKWYFFWKPRPNKVNADYIVNVQLFSNDLKFSKTFSTYDSRGRITTYEAFLEAIPYFYEWLKREVQHFEQQK